MAKNWTPKEAFVAIKADDKAAIMDLGRRFPLMLSVLSRLVAGDSNAAGELLGGLNERVTVRTIESVLKEGVADEEETEEEVETEAVVEVAKPVKPVAKPAKAKGKYDGMSAKDLFVLGKERKLKVVPKLTAEEYVVILEAADKKEAAAAAAKPAAKPAKPAKPVAKPAADDDWDDGDEAETEAPAEDDDWDL